MTTPKKESRKPGSLVKRLKEHETVAVSIQEYAEITGSRCIPVVVEPLYLEVQLQVRQEHLFYYINLLDANAIIVATAGEVEQVCDLGKAIHVDAITIVVSVDKDRSPFAIRAMQGICRI